MTGADTSAADPPDDERLAATRRVGAAARALVGNLVSSRASTEALESAASTIERVNVELAPHAVTSRFADIEGLGMATRFSDRLFESHPFAGPSNPLAPPMAMFETEDGHSAATVTYDHRHEGMPNTVHGGVLAAAFDLILAAAAARAAQRPAPTGRLTIRYRKPTPLHVELRYESTVAKVDGRKIVTTATVSADGVVTAEAEGLFVAARTETIPRVGRGDV